MGIPLKGFPSMFAKENLRIFSCLIIISRFNVIARYVPMEKIYNNLLIIMRVINGESFRGLEV